MKNKFALVIILIVMGLISNANSFAESIVTDVPIIRDFIKFEESIYFGGNTGKIGIIKKGQIEYNSICSSVTKFHEYNKILYVETPVGLFDFTNDKLLYKSPQRYGLIFPYNNGRVFVENGHLYLNDLNLMKNYHQNEISSYDFINNSLATGSIDKTVNVINLETFKVISFNLKSRCRDLKMSSGNMAFAITDSSHIFSINMKTSDVKSLKIITKNAKLRVLEVGQDRIFIGDSKGSVHILNKKLQLHNSIKVSDNAVTAFGLFNGKLYVATLGGHIKIQSMALP